MSKAPSSLVTILSGGLLAGTIDIGAAALINQASVPVILQAIASGVLGKASFQRGASAATLGLFLQWGMSLLIAAIFVYASLKIPALRRRWVKAGLAYGVVVYLVMNYLVLPLSAVGHIPHFNMVRFLENLLAMLLFGLIIAFFARDRVDPEAVAVTT